MEADAFINDVDDMGDLFGDPQPMPTAPIQKGLEERLDELYFSGCCQKLAWSKLGSIACISNDGRSVSVQNFVWDTNKREWSLSKETQLPAMPYHEDLDITHIVWSHSGLELAVVDVAGRVSIFVTVGCLNRFQMAGDLMSDQVDALGGVVGLEWLSQQRTSAPFYNTANRAGSHWTYSTTNSTALGPLHPAGKAALACVTRCGNLRLFFQQPDNSWQETSVELENISATHDLFTHASFGLEKDSSMLLVIHDLAQRLRVYRVKIDWNAANGMKQQQQPLGPNVVLSPRLRVVHVDLIHHCAPSTETSMSAPPDVFTGQRSGLYAQLSHLQVFPASEPPNVQKEPATILAVLSYAQETSDLTLSGGRNSVVARWKLSESPHSLHPSFTQLSSKKPTENGLMSLGTTATFKRVDDTIINGVIIALASLHSQDIITFSYDDGSIQFREKSSMQIIGQDANSDTISFIAHGGYGFGPRIACLHSTLSPNHCVAAIKGADQEVQLNFIEQEAATEITPDSGVSTTLAALALLFAYSCTQHHNNDDVVALIQRSAVLIGTDRLLRELHVAINMTVDYTREAAQDKLLRSSVLSRCLSAQHILGRGDKYLNVSAKIAWVTMNLRFASLNLHFAFSTTTPNDSTNTELPLSILGIIRWFTDLMSLVLDDIIWMSNEANDKQNDREFVQGLVNKSNSPAIFILLCSIPRVFVRFNCRCLRGLAVHAARLKANAQDFHTKKAWTSVHNTIEGSPVSFARFESIVAEMDKIVKATYEESGCSDTDRVDAEKDMLIMGEIPQVLMPVIGRLLSQTIRKFQEDVDPAQLYFTDVRWLGLTDDYATTEYQKKHAVDVVRKLPLRSDARLRRCTRCCAYMEDTVPPRPFQPWMVQLLRTCVCGNQWILVNGQ